MKLGRWTQKRRRSRKIVPQANGDENKSCVGAVEDKGKKTGNKIAGGTLVGALTTLDMTVFGNPN